MQCVGIHHVTLLVDDREKAAWFYGHLLGLNEKPRPGFKFPGLFYHCGDRQEIHLIVQSRPMQHEELYIDVGETPDKTFRHIHRHAALVVEGWNQAKQRLLDNNIEILFWEDGFTEDDVLSKNLVAGWQQMYGAVPLFIEDPFRNLLEIIPASPPRLQK